MPLNRTAVRRRTPLRAFAVLCALALVALLAALPAGASARTPASRHDDPVGLPLAGNPLASIADDGSDPSSGDSSDDSSSDDTSDDDSSDDSSDDDSSSDDSADDDSSDDDSSDDGDGSFEVTCDDSSDDDSTSSDDGDSSDDDPTADASDDDSADGDDSADDDGTECDDESDDDDTSSDDSTDATPKRAPRVSALHASDGKHGVVKVSFRLDRAGRVTLTLQSLAAPAAAHGPKAASHTPKRRTRVVTLHGDDAIRAKAGINRTTFRRWNGHALAAGSYRLTATPSARGGKPVETTFHVAAR